MAEEHDKQVDALEREADQMEEQRDRLDRQIDDTREDFEQKLSSTTAPGLVEEAAAAPGGKGASEDDERVDEDERENVDADEGGPA